MKLFRNLDAPIDNSPLILFRIFFGALMFFEAIGAILLGWVKETFVEPKFTFNFIGLDFLQIFVGPQMYVIYSLMGVFGLMIMLGYRYRLAIISFFILWGITYLLQKSHYNNHYYLVWLIAGMLCIVPANSYASLDVKQGRVAKKLVCPKWCINFFIWQIAIVYFYAAIAKLYPDWLAGKPLEIWYNAKSFQAPFWSKEFAVSLKSFFTAKPTILFFAYAGIFFDLLVAPLFLINRWTRLVALLASLVFHLTNSAIFQIGVFPYFALAFVVFFYEPDFIRRVFFKRKPSLESENLASEQTTVGKRSSFLKYALGAYFIWQFLLPLRHHFIPDNVLWTEEGHRLSWRMMLRTKRAYAHFTIEDKESGKKERIKLSDHVTINQLPDLMSKPDMMWQFAQYLEQYYKEQEGRDVAVYIRAKSGVNGRKSSLITDETIDVAAEPWRTFGHQKWLLPAPF